MTKNQKYWHYTDKKEAGEAPEAIRKKYPAAVTQSVYVLNLQGSEKERSQQRERLEELLTPAEAIQLMMGSEGEEAEKMRETVLQQMNLPEGTDLSQVLAMMPDEALREMKDQMLEQMGDMGDLMFSSVGIAFVKQEYADMGADMEQFQMSYLGGSGLQMLGLALLGMVLSVIVSFLSSRMAARTSRDLRGQIFEKVVSFSNEEMSSFSTSSLITRCTNDVQQVQMVLTMLFRMVAYAPIMGIGGILKVLATQTHMEWIIAVAVVAVLALVAVLMVIAMPKFKKMQKLVDRLNLVSREILTGIPVIRALAGRSMKKSVLTAPARI